MEEVEEGASHQAPQGRGDVSVAELGRRLAEKDGVIQSLQDRLETVELWSQKLEEDRARERAEHAQERLRWERQVFELNLDSKRTTSRLKEDHQVSRRLEPPRASTCCVALRGLTPVAWGLP